MLDASPHLSVYVGVSAGVINRSFPPLFSVQVFHLHSAVLALFFTREGFSSLFFLVDRKIELRVPTTQLLSSVEHAARKNPIYVASPIFEPTAQPPEGFEVEN